MPTHIERTFIRILIGTALCVAILTAALAPTSAMPAVAFGQLGLYRLEVALLAFYGCLLLITPAFSGLIHGRLPAEISTRGAKFAEEADRSAELDEVAFRRLEATTKYLTQALAEARIEIERLSEVSDRDRTQQGVSSEQ
jgi:hypothetical protein